MTEAEARALEIIARVAGCPRDRVTHAQHLLVDLGLDSPKAIDLLVDLETRLGITIGEDEAAAVESVGDVLALVRDKTVGQIAR